MKGIFLKKIFSNFNQSAPNNQKSKADSKSIYINWLLETILAKLRDTLKDENNLSFERSEKSDLIWQNHYSFCYMGPLKLMDSDKKDIRHQFFQPPMEIGCYFS